jgi:DNA-binding XRE family transcriptional regulator
MTRLLTEAERGDMMTNVAQRHAAHHAAGRKLREARTLLGMSPEDLGRSIDRAPTTIKAWESGMVPGKEIRVVICEKLGLMREYMDELWDYPTWKDPRR